MKNIYCHMLLSAMLLKKKMLIGFLGSKWLIKPVLHINASKNVNGSYSRYD